MCWINPSHCPLNEQWFVPLAEAKREPLVPQGSLVVRLMVLKLKQCVFLVFRKWLLLIGAIPIFLEILFILSINNMVIEKIKAKKKNSTLNRYLFEENNSGGYCKYLAWYYKIDDKLKYNICVVEAYTAEEAIKIFQEYFNCDIAEENKNSCSCCWDRFWYIYTDNPEKEYNNTIDIYNYNGEEDIDGSIRYREDRWWKVLYIEN